LIQYKSLRDSKKRRKKKS